MFGQFFNNNKLQRNWVFATNSDFLIQISLQLTVVFQTINSVKKIEFETKTVTLDACKRVWKGEDSLVGQWCVYSTKLLQTLIIEAY